MSTPQMLRLSTVQKGLSSLWNHHPNCGHTMESLQGVARDWHTSLVPLMGERTFAITLTEATGRCKFFPCLADFREVFFDLAKTDALALLGPGPSIHQQISGGATYKSELDRERCTHNIEVLKRLVSGELTVAEADQEIYLFTDKGAQ